MSTGDEIRAAYDALVREGTRLAGGLPALAQRATVYRHIYRASGGNHIFPLIAAHGALWARGYFRFGLEIGRWLSWQYALTPRFRVQQLAALNSFADQLRDINRRVCIDTYANFHFTAQYGETSAAADLVPLDLLEALNRLHAVGRAGASMSAAQRRELFRAHFLNEQTHVVGPRIEAAVATLNWPIVRTIALRPTIAFAYFPAGKRLWFRNFASRDERIANGLAAFDHGAALGWEGVEAALARYNLLPREFFTRPVEHFSRLRLTALSGN